MNNQNLDVVRVDIRNAARKLGRRDLHGFDDERADSTLETIAVESVLEILSAHSISVSDSTLATLIDEFELAYHDECSKIIAERGVSN